jgi:hypothetical protein
MIEYGAIGFVDGRPNRVGRRLCGLRNARVWAREHSPKNLDIWTSSPNISTEPFERDSSTDTPGDMPPNATE